MALNLINKKIVMLACLTFVCALCACVEKQHDAIGWDQETTSVAVISVMPYTTHLMAGQTQQFFAVLGDAAGNRLPVRMKRLKVADKTDGEVSVTGDAKGRTGHELSWRSSQPAVVEIDANGVAKALAAGEVIITAVCDGCAATAKIIVNSKSDNPMALTPMQAGLFVGQNIQLSTIFNIGNGELPVATIKWHSDNSAIATVTQYGLVRAIMAGEVRITATLGLQKANAVINVRPVTIIRGLDFPGNDSVQTTMRFEFENPLSAYPATYIWRAFPRQQQSYYTAFFWGNNGKVYPSKTYYGFHPYPDWKTHYQHFWEIASSPGGDFKSPLHVIYDRWYIQVAVCRQTEKGREIDYYWDWPDTTKLITHNHQTFEDPPKPALIIGDAPWNPGNEVWDGVLRGFQFYSVALTTEEISREIEIPGTIIQPWYLNLDPTPLDISDKSGSINHPDWVGVERPRQWSGQVIGDILIQPTAISE